jgi:hypothetical protein
MSKAQAGFSVFIILIVSLYSFHRVMRYSLENDPKVSLALSAAQTEALPLINNLEDFHRANGFYPRSIKQLPRNNLWGKYLYQTNSLNVVYKSLDCQRRMRDLTGWQTAEKRQKLAPTEDECIQGYSQFVIKSPVHPSHQQTFAFLMFESTNPKWDIDWCNTGDHGRNYCYEDLVKLQNENRQ